MFDVELVIKIPEKIYNYIHNEHIAMRVRDSHKVAQAIANGTILPRGHGRIVDISKMQYMKTLNEAIHGRLSWAEAIRRIKNSTPTIVEADGEGEEV